MRILLVAENFVLNGVTRHIVDLANGLVESGHTVYVASTPSSQTKRLNSIIKFIPIVLCYPDSYKKRYLGIFRSIRILVKTIRENRIEIVHTHKRYADVIGRITARTVGVKHISTCHNEFTNYRWISPFGDITIAPCSEIVQMLINIFNLDRENVKTIFYGIKTLRTFSAEIKRQYKETYNIENDMKVILSVGHLNRQKDRPTLIEAIHTLSGNGQFERAICLIVGEGEEYPLVQSLIYKYKLEAHVKLLPASSDIEALNNIADFCVLSSIHEGAPYVILEAACLGKPHIATSVGFIPSFIGNNEAGICVAARHPQQLADAIYFLLTNPDKANELGKKALERFNQNYTYDKFIENTLSVYKKLLQ